MVPVVGFKPTLLFRGLPVDTPINASLDLGYPIPALTFLALHRQDEHYHTLIPIVKLLRILWQVQRHLLAKLLGALQQLVEPVQVLARTQP